MESKGQAGRRIAKKTAAKEGIASAKSTLCSYALPGFLQRRYFPGDIV